MIKISRSALELYLSCKKCFVLQYKHKIRPFSLPFTLNVCVDELFKREADAYREKNQKHPALLEKGLNASFFKHELMDEWRQNFQGLKYFNDTTGILFSGAVDDVLEKDNGQLIVCDIKATSKINFDWAETCRKYTFPDSYVRQLECYQYLLAKNGFDVAKEGFLIYYNGQKDRLFEQKIHFDLHLIEIDCDYSWIDDALIAARDCLQSEEMPSSSENCENCNYLKKRWQLSQQNPEVM